MITKAEMTSGINANLERVFLKSMSGMMNDNVFPTKNKIGTPGYNHCMILDSVNLDIA